MSPTFSAHAVGPKYNLHEDCRWDASPSLYCFQHPRIGRPANHEAIWLTQGKIVGLNGPNSTSRAEV